MVAPTKDERFSLKVRGEKKKVEEKNMDKDKIREILIEEMEMKPTIEAVSCESVAPSRPYYPFIK